MGPWGRGPRGAVGPRGSAFKGQGHNFYFFILSKQNLTEVLNPNQLFNV